MKIWLDDIRDAPDETWTVARTARDALLMVNENVGNVEVLSLDHDLGDENELTGYDVLSILEKLVGTGELLSVIIPNEFRIHSANPVGRKNMQAAIDSIEKMRKHQNKQENND